MKFCSKCGKEIAEDAVICVGCGCVLEAETQSSLKGIKISRKKIVISIAAIVVLACVVVGAAFLMNKQKESQKYEAFVEALEGETYEYIGYTVCYSLTFKENQKCERYIGLYSTNFESTSLFDYSIEFTDDKVYILLLKKDGVAQTFEAEIGYGNKVIALIDEDTGNRYN